jgi:hypothetical protein
MKLFEDYRPCYIQQYGPIESTYLIHDNNVLMERVNTTREAEYYKLEMTISEGSIKDGTWRPRYIDVDR